jgi:Tubulin-tyrosine ligase family
LSSKKLIFPAEKDPNEIWDQIDKSIASVYLAREQDFSALISRYKYKRNFFEMVRFDFIVDENFKVHLLEVKWNIFLHVVEILLDVVIF